MNSCEKTQKLLVLHREGALDAAEDLAVRAHLEECPGCRREAGGIDAVRGWLRDPKLFSPEAGDSWHNLPGTLAARAQASRSAAPWLPANRSSLAWALSMAAMAVVAFGLVWMAHRGAPENPPAVIAARPGNEAFLNRIQSAYAREATAQYLAACQDLLLNLMRTQQRCEGNTYDVSIEIAQARDLLQRGRMLDLQAPDVARAKELCDELDSFLVHLSTSDRCETFDKMNRMEDYIRKERLLLRIHLIQSELS